MNIAVAVMNSVEAMLMKYDYQVLISAFVCVCVYKYKYIYIYWHFSKIMYWFWLGVFHDQVERTCYLLTELLVMVKQQKEYLEELENTVSMISSLKVMICYNVAFKYISPNI